MNRRAFLGWTSLASYGTWALLRPSPSPHRGPKPKPTTTTTPPTTTTIPGGAWSDVWSNTW